MLQFNLKEVVCKMRMYKYNSVPAKFHQSRSFQKLSRWWKEAVKSWDYIRKEDFMEERRKLKDEANACLGFSGDTPGDLEHTSLRKSSKMGRDNNRET